LSALEEAPIPNGVKIMTSPQLTALLDVHETGVPAERLLLLAPFRAAILEPHLQQQDHISRDEYVDRRFRQETIVI
jgi:hypothetical protein